MLSDFSVVYEAGEFGGRGTLVHSFDGQQLVLTTIPRETLEDYFEVESLEADQRALLVDRNRESFSAIASRKYDAKDFTFYEKHGYRYPLVTIRLEDMQCSGLEFTKSVLEMARASGFR